MQVIIDRFEGVSAIVELPDRMMTNMPRILLPKAKERDIINISIDTAATQDRKVVVKKLMDEVRK